jgi:hypothetical protein
MSNHEEHPFYGYEIYRHEQEILIQKIVAKYKGQEPSEALKKAVWDELQLEKAKGNITIPFKIATRRDPYRKFPDQIEIILDTKV